MRRFWPILVLFLLSPLIAEVIFGATPLSNLGGLVVAGPLYGAGALLIRDVVRGRGGGWLHIALLGAAYALVEEGLALESIFSFEMFNAGTYGARIAGINGVWTEWTIGYHIMWSITLPIVLAELFFSEHRALPWLNRVGLVIVTLLYAVAAVALGLITRNFVAPNYRLPLPMIIGTVVVLVAVVALALSLPTRAGEPSPVTDDEYAAPSPWLVWLVTLVASGQWFALSLLPDAWRTGMIVLLPMVVVLAVALGACALLRHWSAPGRRWTEMHRYAAAMGPLLVVMAMGYFRITAGNPTDQMFQGIVSVIVLLGMFWYGWHLQQREHVALESVTQG